MRKTPDQIKSQLTTYYLSEFVTKYEKITGKEQFTLFDKLPVEIREELLKKFEMNQGELVVFVLFSRDCVILNTTERFIKLDDGIDEIYYVDFDGHSGYTKGEVTDLFGSRITVKAEGYFQDFELKLKDGNKKTWMVPSGEAGFAFWGVTKKCEFIGRKYLSKA